MGICFPVEKFMEHLICSRNSCRWWEKVREPGQLWYLQTFNYTSPLSRVSVLQITVSSAWGCNKPTVAQVRLQAPLWPSRFRQYDAVACNKSLTLTLSETVGPAGAFEVDSLEVRRLGVKSVWVAVSELEMNSYKEGNLGVAETKWESLAMSSYLIAEPSSRMIFHIISSIFQSSLLTTSLLTCHKPCLRLF